MTVAAVSSPAAGASFSTATTLVSGTTTPVALPVLALLPPALGLLAQETRPRFPQLSPADIVGSLKAAEKLRARGLEPVITSSPFTGDVVISTKDQAAILPTLVREAAERQLPSPIDPQEIFAGRQALIEALAETAVERGFFATTADIPEGLRGQFIRETAESPLTFRPFPEVPP